MTGSASGSDVLRKSRARVPTPQRDAGVVAGVKAENAMLRGRLSVLTPPRWCVGEMELVAKWSESRRAAGWLTMAAAMADVRDICKHVQEGAVT